MLTLRESRTGRPVRLGASRGGLVLRAGGPLLAYLLVDVIRRFAETGGRPALVDWADAEPPNAAELTLLPPTGAATSYDLAVGDPDPGARHWLTCSDVSIPPVRDGAAVRLALLRLGRGPEPAALDEAAIGSSARLLAHWRERVAAWANEPGRPMSADHVTRFRTALGDDLDIPRALDVLDDLDRDPDIAGGAKFETAVHLDRVLALDLPREIGR
jgi:hypothetical protein